MNTSDKKNADFRHARIKDEAAAYIDEQRSIFTDLSDYIWENPELSLQEYKAAEAYIKVLREGGFEVTEKLGGIDTAFCGSFGSGRPVIGILGEFDALSGLSQKKGAVCEDPITAGGPGHGCGHNMLGTGALAAAFAIRHYLMTTGRAGTVIFYGCPGEEGGAAKAFLAREDAFRSLDAALTWHPKDVNEVVSGTNNSSLQVLYAFNGCAAHAAGDPENGRSALDAVELMNIGVQYLREHMTDDCRIHYAMVDSGGISPNVVQAHASVLYMVRANKVRDSVKLLERVDKVARGAAMMTETQVERTFIDGTAELVPNYVLEQVCYDNFAYFGVPGYDDDELAFAKEVKKTCPAGADYIGAKYDDDVAARVEEASCKGTLPLNDFLVPLVHTTGFMAGSSDVGDVSWETPTAQIHVTAFISGAPGHSWQNVSSGGGTIGHKALLHAGKVLAAAAIDLYEDPQLLGAAREEFDKRTRSGYVCPIEKDAVPTVI